MEHRMTHWTNSIENLVKAVEICSMSQLAGKPDQALAPSWWARLTQGTRRPPVCLENPPACNWQENLVPARASA